MLEEERVELLRWVAAWRHGRNFLEICLGDVGYDGFPEVAYALDVED